MRSSSALLAGMALVVVGCHTVLGLTDYDKVDGESDTATGSDTGTEVDTTFTTDTTTLIDTGSLTDTSTSTGTGTGDGTDCTTDTSHQTHCVGVSEIWEYDACDVEIGKLATCAPHASCRDSEDSKSAWCECHPGYGDHGGTACNLCVRYVDAAVADGDGLTWETALNTIERGIESAFNSGEAECEVWIKTGTYRPIQATAEATINLEQSVPLYGGFSTNSPDFTSRTPLTTPSIINGNLGIGVSARHVLTATDGARLDGLLISGGLAESTDDNSQNGGGLLISGGEVTIVGCRFENNTARGLGGAIALSGHSVLSISDTTFSNNSAANGGALAFFSTANTSTLTVERSVFDDNGADQPIALYNLGGAVYLEGLASDIAFSRSTFRNNHANGDGVGGALYAKEVSVSVVNCLFHDNYAGHTTQQGVGGAMAGFTSQFRVHSSTFAGNEIRGLTTALGGAIFLDSATTLHLRNSIVWNNLQVRSNGTTPGGISPLTSSDNWVYSDLQDGVFSAGNNISADPKFVDWTNRDLHLSADSPCINAGTVDPPAPPSDDLDGNPRPAPNNAGATNYDQGAYEWQPPLGG